MHTHHAQPPGKPTPLGATPMTVAGCNGVNFAVRSPLATSMTLCIFAADGEESRFAMRVVDGVWCVWLADLGVGCRYGFRADGESSAKQVFNPQKLLLDPYAKAVDGKPRLADADDYRSFVLTDEQDNAAVAPKAIVADTSFAWGDDKAVQIAWSETIIYELHVKGFTRLHPDVPAELRGTYAALASPVVIRYLRNLGITTVELLPIAYGVDEPHLQRKGLSNYWNYNTLSPFAVEPNYWSGRPGSTPLSEFKQAVKALHTAGIEVILDVVFNHSAEAERHHPAYCQRGIANDDFYWLADDGSTVNYTGCGNSINAKHPATRQWIIDCLCYWVTDCHVDGFRFDLATVLGRQPHFDSRADFFQALAAEPVLSNVKLIAEPWDIGDNGYQLGNFPVAFGEWNDRFRDDMRAFFNHQSGQLGAFADRLAGSAAIFQPRQKLPHHSVNFITAHDGFTLADLLSYNAKHNHANGEDNRDGHNHNLSDNHGVEGDTDDEAILALRRHTQRALLAALLLANGTPMLLAGDEIGHSQGGNNNAYCQDNPGTWIDWSSSDNDLHAYVSKLINCRKDIALLHNDNWWNAADVAWLNAAANPMRDGDWHAATALQVQLHRRVLLLVNGRRQAQNFILPKLSQPGSWHVDGVTCREAVVVENLGIKLLRYY